MRQGCAPSSFCADESPPQVFLQGRVTVRPVRAEHRDLTGRDDAAIGLRIELTNPENRVCCVGLSGDTRLLKESADSYKDVDLMVVHIGSLYEYDVGEGERPWHLGFSGAVGLLEGIRECSRPDWDPLVLISEWGEELAPDRTAICEALSTTVGLRRVFPAELFQCVALKPSKAEPICAANDGNVATIWQETVPGRIEYLCTLHAHPRTR